MEKLQLILLFLSLTIVSCKEKQNELSEKLIGQWVIEDFNHKSKDLKFEYYVNVLSINENSLTLPESRDPLVKTDNSDWEIIFHKDEKPLLRLSSPDSSFAGVYKMEFFKNHQKKLLGLKLDSGNSSIVLYKSKQNFDLDGNEWEIE